MIVLLYDEGISEKLNLAEIAEYLKRKMKKVEVELRRNPFAISLDRDRIPDYAARIASVKVRDATEEISAQEPLYAEIEYERKRISGKTTAFGVAYDGFQLQRIFREALQREELSPEFAHILFTNRLVVTWNNTDQRYHARTSIYSTPSVISTTGIVEAPAKPREYYLLKQQYQQLGRDLAELKEEFKGRFIDYDDDRLTEVVKGYAMQAVFYSLTGDAFCPDKGCRLYNAHWQEELIYAQLESGYEFCPRHTELLANPIFRLGSIPVAKAS